MPAGNSFKFGTSIHLYSLIQFWWSEAKGQVPGDLTGWQRHKTVRRQIFFLPAMRNEPNIQSRGDRGFGCVCVRVRVERCTECHFFTFTVSIYKFLKGASNVCHHILCHHPPQKKLNFTEVIHLIKWVSPFFSKYLELWHSRLSLSVVTTLSYRLMSHPKSYLIGYTSQA